ncbi:hypothetical protein K474DRAFT_1024588 [Panus rudis PR-1116 ss-1]|nr:hypothetical protein K474DRAFT_1024588 [Panus rudis PR-1116 ss-1]
MPIQWVSVAKIGWHPLRCVSLSHARTQWKGLIPRRLLNVPYRLIHRRSHTGGLVGLAAVPRATAAVTDANLPCDGRQAFAIDGDMQRPIEPTWSDLHSRVAEERADPALFRPDPPSTPCCIAICASCFAILSQPNVAYVPPCTPQCSSYPLPVKHSELSMRDESTKNGTPSRTVDALRTWSHQK